MFQHLTGPQRLELCRRLRRHRGPADIAAGIYLAAGVWLALGLLWLLARGFF